jgi:hypothetical protein
MTVILQLGEIVFQENEVPDSINFGGKQGMAVHQLVGGSREINCMGSIPDNLSWSGLFFGQTATFRAKFLDTMRSSGMIIPLTWGQFSYNVVISHFSGKFERSYQIPYSITVVVKEDLTQPLQVLLPVGYDDAIQNMLIEANDITFLLNYSPISAAMETVNLLIGALPSIAGASSNELALLAQSILKAQSAVLNTINILTASTFT